MLYLVCVYFALQSMRIPGTEFPSSDQYGLASTSATTRELANRSSEAKMVVPYIYTRDDNACAHAHTYKLTLARNGYLFYLHSCGSG